MTPFDRLVVDLIGYLRHLAWGGMPTEIDVDMNNLRFEKETSAMSKTLSVGSDFIGKMRAILPIRLKDPVSNDVHAPGTPTAVSSDEGVAKVAIYNLMLAVAFEGVGECDVQLEDQLPNGRVIKMGQPIHVIVTQDPQPTEIDVDTDEVTFEPESTQHP